MGERVPQHVQNIILRNYCSKKKIILLLSSVEYAFEDSQFILNQILNDIGNYDGVVAYSLFQLPQKKTQRDKVYKKIIANSKIIFFALEEISIRNQEDIKRVENIWSVKKILPFCLNNISNYVS